MSATPNTAFSGATVTPEGLSFNGNLFKPVVEQCEGCSRSREVEGQKFCVSYAQPASKWNMGNCNFATHLKMSQGAQTKVNPLKASKRAAKGR